ncbi:hypothetical protein MKZ38_003326 [Zalerion maritima]|uniref:Uncharacterized protein n=1 Tax=Zalerion maritima TaxID=339359 RepID=A0AAD5RMW2_9PEZI|nr:hypothetical protein MKZ38_003326 [Zalerion maritima]
MHLAKLLIPLAVVLAGEVSVVLAHGDGGNSTSASSQCRTMSKLSRLIDTANNATRLDDKSDGNATRAAEIQARASAAVDTLTELQSNDTLVAACAQRAAVEDMEDDCKLASKLEKEIEKASSGDSNSTDSKRITRRAHNQPLTPGLFPVLAVRRKHSGNETIDLAAAQETLSALSSNETLQQFCAARATAEDCSKMAKLTKIVDMASNDTLLEEKFGDDSDKLARLQAKATEAESELGELTGNSTLVGICDAQAETENAGTETDDAEEVTTTDGGESAATALSRPIGLAGSVMGMLGVGAFMVFL